MAKPTINMIVLAAEISKREGGKYNLPIAQISEVLKHAMMLMGEVDDVAILNTVDKYRFRQGLGSPRSRKSLKKKGVKVKRNTS